MKNTLLPGIRNRAVRFVLLGIFAGGFVVSLAGQALLVEDGQPRAAIVIAGEPTRMQQLAAEELQKYIKKISGAELPIGTAPVGELPMTIYVGESEHTRELGLTTDGLDYGAYRIQSGDGYLALVGRDDNYFMDKPGDGGAVYASGRRDQEQAREAWREQHGEMWVSPFSGTFTNYNSALGVWSTDEYGSLNAVNDFLRWLGVRWYMPGDFGEVCPAMASIPAPEIDAAVHPEWKQREIHFHSARPFQVGADEMLWRLRLGLRSLEEQFGGHGTGNLLQREWVKQHHPEFYALYGGERATAGHGKPCYSSTGLFESGLGFSQLLFDEYNKDIVSLMPTDAYTAFCQCELCVGKDTPERGFQGMMSDYVWDFMNRVAAESAKTHPDKDIMNYAYNTYLLPPENIEQFHPNLRVGICGGRKAFTDPAKKQAALDIREGYLAKLPSGKISLWEYYNVALGVPCYFTGIIAEDLKYLKGRIDGTMIEFTRGKRISDNDLEPDSKLATSHLNLWLTTRLWWNPDAEELWWNKGRSVAELLDEYYVNFYGPAAAEMKAFIEYCEEYWPAMGAKAEPIDQAFELIARAREAAGEDSIYARRVQLVSDYLEPLKIVREQLNVGRDDNPRATFAERNRDDVRIDGKLDDVFWQGLTTYELVDVRTGEPVSNKTTFKVAWAGDSLYFAIRCEEEQMDALVTPATRNGDNTIYDGDSIELLLETPTHAYYQISIDPKGLVNDLDRPGAGMIGRATHINNNTLWDAGIELAAHRGDDYWSLEIRVPAMGPEQEEILPNFGVAGDKPSTAAPWYFNVCRIRRAGGGLELSTFSPTYEGGFHFRGRFAKLLPEETTSRYSLTTDEQVCGPSSVKLHFLIIFLCKFSACFVTH